MARWLMGMLIGAVLMMGIAADRAAALGVTRRPPHLPAAWVDTPMHAHSGTHLAHFGFCRRGYEVRQLDGWQSTHYRCRPQ